MATKRSVKRPAAKKRPSGAVSKPSSRPRELAIQPAPGKPILITDVALRDGHQSLLATRMRTEDMLPIAEKLDDVGFWSLEVWGGATFDTCLRFLNEDPWERLRQLKAHITKTPLADAAPRPERRGLPQLRRRRPRALCRQRPRRTAWTSSASSMP